MKRTIQMIMIILVCLGLFTGCEMKVPNPLIGCYVLPAESVGASEYDLAALSLYSDNTFIYTEVITGTSQSRTVEGTYEMVLQAYNFLAADGNLYLNVKETPADVDNFVLEKGTNPFLYDWKCDKDKGPQSLTLVRDEANPGKNFELIYVGGPNELSHIVTTQKTENIQIGNSYEQ